MSDRSTHHISTESGDPYTLHFTPLATLPALMREAGMKRQKCLLCTDENVAEHYLSSMERLLDADGWNVRSIVVPAGEASKSAQQLQHMYDEAFSWGIDRRTPLVALGGGVVGDLGGFAASTLLRGIPLVHVPTTLIAQVDSSIGGKTGINHPAGKNLIGAFYPPRFILSDLSTLETLPDLEWTSGLAEVVKHACIHDKGFLARLADEWDLVLQRDPKTVASLVQHAAGIKIRVVEEDEHEAGRRAILNFGHTFGHAIERVAGYGTFTHGEAVALGMKAAIHLSQRLHPDTSFDEAREVVERLPHRGTLEGLAIDRLMEAMASDKKAVGSTLRLVVLRRVGEAYVRSDVSDKFIRDAWAHLKRSDEAGVAHT